MNIKNDGNKYLIFYLFDWDENVLNMSTNVKLDHLVNGEWVIESISTELFTKLRHNVVEYYAGRYSEWRFANNNSEITYSEFRDSGVRGDNAFLEDSIYAITTKNFGPVWYDFIECLIKGSLFGIITARGHEPSSIRKTVKWIIYNQLSAEQFSLMVNNLKGFKKMFGENYQELSDDEIIYNYLESCEFAGISSSWFANKYNTEAARGTPSPEQFKIMVVKDFIIKINRYAEKLNKKVKIGFSDDDIANITTVRDYIKYKLSVDFPNIEFHIYHTFKDGKYKLD